MDLLNLRNSLVSGYAEYLISKVGSEKAKKADGFTQYGYLQNACAAAQKLAPLYDYGIALAVGGMWLGYIFELLKQLPVLTVQMKRRLNGALWMPIDDVTVIEGKRVLVFDNDVVTGRTLRRALREITKLRPASVDLLLVYGHTEVSHDKFQSWERFLKPDCKILGSQHGNIHLDTMCQIPEGFTKIMSVENSFNPLDQELVVQLLTSQLTR